VPVERQHPSLVPQAISVPKAPNLRHNSPVHSQLCVHQREPPHIPSAQLARPVNYASRELKQLLIALLAKTAEQPPGCLATAQVANTHRPALV